MKAKIKSVQGNGTWEGNYGLMYSFDIELSDGVSGVANGKTQEYRFKVGDDVEYELKGKTPQGVNKLTISKPDSDFQSKGGYKDSSNAILMQVCLKEVCEFHRLNTPYTLSDNNINEIAEQTLQLAKKVKSNIEKL